MIQVDIKSLTLSVIFMLIITYSSVAIGCTSNDHPICEGYRDVVRDQVKDIDILSQVTIEEIEKESYKEILIARNKQGGEKIPDSPFGLRQKAWDDFKKKIKPEDCLMFFKTNSKSWDELRGRSGYMIVRSGQIVEVFIVGIN